MYRKTYIEINVNNIVHNVKTIINNYPDYKYYFGIVKGNVYGHGYEIVKDLINSGINYLAVSSLEEAIEIRKISQDIPVLCLQPIHIKDIEDAIKYNVTITVTNLNYLNDIIKLNLNNELKIHLKINSGFNRLGIDNKDELKNIVDKIKSNPLLKLEGIFSHFATSGKFDKHWDNQLASFIEITSLINLKEIPIVHFGNSLTLLNHKKIDFCNGIRIGIIMYGYTRKSDDNKNLLSYIRQLKNKINKVLLNISETINEITEIYKPAFCLYSEIIEIRKINKDSFVGYGASFKADKDCSLAYASIGYSDGLSKRNENGFVYINNKRYKIICIDMNITTILIDDSIKLYDKIEFLGNNISMKEFSNRNNTNAYEILCEFKESIPRIIINK